MNAEQECTFFAFYKKDLPRLNNECFTSIQVGRDQASSLLANTIGDNTGDHISAESETWSELTVLYWMWKNVDATFYGLFDPAKMLELRSRSNSARYSAFGAEEQSAFGWDWPNVRRLCNSFDAIMPKQHPVHVVDVPHKTLNNFDFYAMYYGMDGAEALLRTVKDVSPDLLPYFIQHFYSRNLSPTLTTIMRRDIFHRYASCTFGILFEYERRDFRVAGRDACQMRDAARLIADAYFSLLADEGGVKLQRLSTARGTLRTPLQSVETILSNTSQQRRSSKTLAVDETIEIALGIDEAYSAHASVTITSLLHHLANEQHVRIFVIHDDSLTAESKRRLRSLKDVKINTEVAFTLCNRKHHNYLPNNRPHISQATYFRLSLHQILPKEIDKIVYLDSDTVITDNIAHLWVVDVDGYILAACPDEGGLQQSRRLQLPKQHTYFNAGVCIFNLLQLRKLDIERMYFDAYCDKADVIILQDQDILNLISVGRVKILPLRWNANTRIYMSNELEHEYTVEEAVAAGNFPAIIHFTDALKPWNSHCDHPLAQLYWEWRSTTPWAETKKRRLLDRLPKPPIGRRFDELPTHAELANSLVNTTQLSRILAQAGLAIDRTMFPVGAFLYSLKELVKHSLARDDRT